MYACMPWCPPAPPEPEQLGSHRAIDAACAVCWPPPCPEASASVKSASHTRTMLAAPAVATIARSVFARRALRSKAKMVPVRPTMLASCVVLLPGAAQASTTHAPGGGASASAGRHEQRSCKMSLPVSTSVCPCRLVLGGNASRSGTSGSATAFASSAGPRAARTSSTLAWSVFTRTYRGSRSLADGCWASGAAAPAALPLSVDGGKAAVSAERRSNTARQASWRAPPLTPRPRTHTSCTRTAAR